MIFWGGGSKDLRTPDENHAFGGYKDLRTPDKHDFKDTGKGKGKGKQGKGKRSLNPR